MAGSQNQKLKTLYLMQYFYRYTDEENGVTTEDIIAHLAVHNIDAERKSIYSDIELLRGYGMDIIKVGQKHAEYRLVSREFQLPELKLLVDAVGAAKFITHKKSLALIKKLESLASLDQARQLRRNVYVDNRIKVMNESIYYNVDAIHAAVNNDRQLSFQYFNYSREKERVLRKNGAPYIVCPLALTFSDGNYYLYAYDSGHNDTRTYRVDRMVHVEVLGEKRRLPGKLHDFDPAVHTNEMFSMYGGERRAVTLSFAGELATVVIDRFGADIIMTPEPGGWFNITADVVVSPTFLGWVFGFGANARIVAPADVVNQFAQTARQIAAQYP